MQHEDSIAARRRSRLSVPVRGVLLQVLVGGNGFRCVEYGIIRRVISLVMLTCVSAFAGD